MHFIWVRIKFILFLLTIDLSLSLVASKLLGISGKYGKEIDEGSQHFRGLCWEQERLVTNLIAAIDTGDLNQAKDAYRASRVPYEQIETLAPSFPDEDCAIDCRPYAYDKGEIDPKFEGFHKVESALYRDEDLKTAGNYSRGLFKIVFDLCRKMQNTSIYSAEKSWEGLLALSIEVGAKKISSEEETWSDLSLLIFRENWKGIFSQYAPFAKLISQPKRRAVWLAYQNLTKYYTVVLDPNNGWEEGLNFRPYSSVPIRERKGITDRSYEFAVALQDAHDELFASAKSD